MWLKPGSILLQRIRYPLMHMRQAKYLLLPAYRLYNYHSKIYRKQEIKPNPEDLTDLKITKQRRGQGDLFSPKLEKRSFIQSMWSYISHFLRFIQLCFILFPPVILLPLRFFDCTKDYWMDTFVKAIQRAGVVWIKAFQYLSHRRDMIGPDMADKFIYLRENAPKHSFQVTKEIFRQFHGKQINEIFQQFDEQPLASGSVGQVYKAIYKGKKVAVKVRHPGVDKHIERDINLLFFISRTLGIFFKSFYIPVGQQSLKKTLVDQINFFNEEQNLNIFNKMFEGRKQITFPKAFGQETRQALLVQTFVQGVPITYYQENKHFLNSVIARIGAKTFFEMFIIHDLIHADCHGGNILVEIKESSENFVQRMWGQIKQVYYYVEQIIIESKFQNNLLRKLYAESKREEASVRKMLRKCKEQVKVTLIDVGMTIELKPQDKKNFISFIKNVIEGQGEKCAQMICKLSNFKGKKIQIESFSTYYQELKKLFSVIDKAQLDDLEGVELFTGMLDLIRSHNMKLDGQFATLLTNMLVLQAIAKDIDPNIKLLKCAIPYFTSVKNQIQLHE